jgi:hypothetical protein
MHDPADRYMYRSGQRRMRRWLPRENPTTPTIRKTVREPLAGRKYSIDYYQHEYKWQTKQVN